MVGVAGGFPLTFMKLVCVCACVCPYARVCACSRVCVQAIVPGLHHLKEDAGLLKVLGAIAKGTGGGLAGQSLPEACPSPPPPAPHFTEDTGRFKTACPTPHDGLILATRTFATHAHVIVGAIVVDIALATKQKTPADKNTKHNNPNTQHSIKWWALEPRCSLNFIAVTNTDKKLRTNDTKLAKQGYTKRNP